MGGFSKSPAFALSLAGGLDAERQAVRRDMHRQRDWFPLGIASKSRDLLLATANAELCRIGLRPLVDDASAAVAIKSQSSNLPPWGLRTSAS
ncbi:hypothetical protein LB535_23540 [Mesorhizobium sp. CA10]|uniref:hypothetical protein n=1 Tax=Mesorhizobium sp. CA10 TaxID=588495 RepID=UPI001CC906FF|nr:hypothetical protein [Mesorhizobium sp. CA10]MBZ9885313.1 hypothetical protein [Mesorhizobium sp. CA10]